MAVKEWLDTSSAWEDLESSAEALQRFIKRAAVVFENELALAGIEHHAVNDYERACGQDGFGFAISASLWSDGAGLAFDVHEGLGYGSDNVVEVPHSPAISSLSNGELKKVFSAVTELIAKRSKMIVFTPLYCPKAVSEVWQCNNFRISFRYVKAWDPVRSSSLMRFDFVYKDLSA